MLSAWWRRLVSAHTVSAQWLREQDRRDSRQGVEGVAWAFPVKKLLNESSLWNTHKLKRSA